MKEKAQIIEKFNEWNEIINKKGLLLPQELREISQDIVELGKSEEAMALLRSVNQIILNSCAKTPRVGDITILERDKYLDDVTGILIGNYKVMLSWPEFLTNTDRQKAAQFGVREEEKKQEAVVQVREKNTESTVLLPGKLEGNMTASEKIIEALQMIDVTHATRSRVSAAYFQQIQDLLLSSGEDLKVRNLYWRFTAEMQRHYRGEEDLKEILQKNYEILYKWLEKGLTCQVEGVNPPSQVKQFEIVKERRINL